MKFVNTDGKMVHASIHSIGVTSYIENDGIISRSDWSHEQFFESHTAIGNKESLLLIDKLNGEKSELLKSLSVSESVVKSLRIRLKREERLSDEYLNNILLVGDQLKANGIGVNSAFQLSFPNGEQYGE